MYFIFYYYHFKTVNKYLIITLLSKIMITKLSITINNSIFTRVINGYLLVFILCLYI